LRVNINIPDKKFDDMADASKETLLYLEDQVEKQVTSNVPLMQQIKNLVS
jgi:hypothetical protein